MRLIENLKFYGISVSRLERSALIIAVRWDIDLCYLKMGRPSGAKML